MLPTVILRHRKENLKKCSLMGLENHPNFTFFIYPNFDLQFPDLSNYVMLSMNSKVELTKSDSSKGLFILDATWKYAERMQKVLGLARISHKLLQNLDSTVHQSLFSQSQSLISNNVSGVCENKSRQTLQQSFVRFCEQSEQKQKMELRKLPGHFKTAYPRRQNDCFDPARGLASIEAIYIAYKILEYNTDGLLDNYYWRKSFLEKNKF